MSDYQKVEVGTGTDEPQPFSEKDVEYLEQQQAEEQQEVQEQESAAVEERLHEPAIHQ